MDDTGGVWRVTVRSADGATATLVARALICAVDQFANPVVPNIKGANDSSGEVYQTAAWPDGVDLTGRRVAVIGAGATGFQLVPAIAETAAHVDVYQRTPQWMAPNPNYHAPVGAGAQWAIRHLPFYGRWVRFVSWFPLLDALDEQVRIDPVWDNSGLSCNRANLAIGEPYAYLGITVPGLPNLFCMCGLGTNAVNGASII